MPDLAQTWNKTLEIIAQDPAKPGYETWLKSTQPLAFHDNTLILAVPNHFAKSYLEERFSSRLCSVLSLLLQTDISLEFVAPPEDGPEAEEHLNDTGAANATAQPVTEEPPYQLLNPKYTFDTFVVGSGNRLAHAASLAVAEAPANAYNPLFMYGGVGLGKTHLMRAIAYHVLRKNPRRRVVYVSAETFANEMINAIRDRKQGEFRNRYRNVDVLLVDDIQFLAGKESTQEEFFHTFNTLHEARRQIVLTSDRPPKEIPTLEERLRSRFEWGLISDIQAPDLETRIAILRKKAQAEALDIPDTVMMFIAEQVTTNIRELEGALIRLVAYSSLHRRNIDLDLAREALRDILPQNTRRQVTIKLIQEVVAQYYDIDNREMKVRKRTRAVAFPRQVAMFLARELTDCSLPRIGEEFGGRDHTTVMHACEKIARDIQVDQGLAQTINALRKTILG